MKVPKRLAPIGWPLLYMDASLYPGINTLTIQTGTCITYDIVDSMGQYLGGGISPGLDMRFRAMHTFTAKLPLVKKEKIAFLTGKNTT
jgi:type III pantothenate kinase